MRIAIFSDNYTPDKNGVSMSVENFSKLLAADGHQIMIFCPKKGRFFVDKKQPNITVKRYNSITAPSNKDTKLALPFIWTAVKDLRDFNPDIVHIQTPLGLGLMGLWAARILKIKTIQTYHTYIPDFLIYLSPKALLGLDKIIKYLSNSRLARKVEAKSNIDEGDVDFGRLKLHIGHMLRDVLESKGLTEDKKLKEIIGKRITKFVYNKSDLVLTPSKSMKNYLKTHGVTKRVEVMSNGIDNSMFKQKTDYSIKNRIIYTGRLGFEKDVDKLIEAFYIAQKTKLELKLDIWGDGPARKSLQVLVNKLGIGKKVCFKGFYDINKVAYKISEYDFFITASLIETQGIVLLEAMSSGLPVVAVDKFAVKEVVLNGKNGYLSKPGDVDGLAKNILKMYANEDKLKEFGLNSIKMAESHEVTKCKEKLYKAYQTVSGVK